MTREPEKNLEIGIYEHCGEDHGTSRYTWPGGAPIDDSLNATNLYSRQSSATSVLVATQKLNVMVVRFHNMDDNPWQL